ncbi:MAG: dUTP diphosphatase [Desulfobulbaceae bacterium]|uniref:Deoxyuridine 5'-triphosphate nucleotidohydrolase n=1 Tax=Candidatus Desulfobia pelagia TaxID=2841692 RepID=A0A8J6NE85_9BACT|nr:dUTP diphosphatase [Candidatus Desulfobia pelagia]
MPVVPLEICWLDPEQSRDLPLPAYHSVLAAGLDMAAAITESVTLASGDILMIPTGFSVAIPAGFELQVRPRSGLAIKHGVTVVNSPGTIDADYRGEVKVGLINLGKKDFTINRGDRIAQMILAPVSQASLRVVPELTPTSRQDGGFGHTGI